MNISDIKIGKRLAIGYGVLLLASLVAAPIQRLSHIREPNSNIIEREWGKAEAAPPPASWSGKGGKGQLAALADESHFKRF